MAYGMHWREEELEFPSLMSNTQIDVQFETKQRAAQPDTFKPIDVVRKRLPQVADRMELLWGGGGFDRYVTSVLTDPSGRPAPLPPDVLKAILALQKLHKESAPIPGPISSWVPDGAPRRA